jgi:hypothetical protein
MLNLNFSLLNCATAKSLTISLYESDFKSVDPLTFYR